MLLHYPPPNPQDCIRDDCRNCRFIERCREILNKSLKEIEEEARKNSLGCLEWEGYSPDE